VTIRRWSGIAGIVFVVLAVLSAIVRGSIPDTSKRNAVEKFLRFYANKSHNTHAIVAVTLGFIGLFFFTWFLGGVWSAIREADGRVSAPTIIVAIGGAVFVAMGFAYHAVDNIQGITLHFDKGYRASCVFNPGTAILLNDLALGLRMASMLGIGAATAAAGVVIRRTRVFPGWLAWVGFVIAVLALPVIPPLSLLSSLLFAVWTIVISVIFLTRPEPAT
jgi:hypothetical protein